MMWQKITLKKSGEVASLRDIDVSKRYVKPDLLREMLYNISISS
jgi:hypothetical protein